MKLPKILDRVISSVTPEKNRPITDDPSKMTPPKGANPDQLAKEKKADTSAPEAQTKQASKKLFQQQKERSRSLSDSTSKIYGSMQQYQPGFHKMPKDPMRRAMDNRKASNRSPRRVSK